MKKLLATVAVAAGAWYWHRLAQPSVSGHSGKPDQRPTLFVPGYAGTRWSFGNQINRLQRHHYGVKSAVIEVKRDGTLKITGKPQMPGGLIQVLLHNNRADIEQQIEWLWHILVVLKNKYHVIDVNLVAHSMAGVVVLDYLSHYSKADLPAHVAKVVLLGIPLNDRNIAQTTYPLEHTTLTPTGPEQPAPRYQHIFARRDAIDATTSFLNIIGQLPGTQSDGAVAKTSAQTLRYLLRHPAQYRELVVTGLSAAHELLHENRTVDSALAAFLFDEKPLSS